MSVIQYKDSAGNVQTVNAIKGDRGPIGIRGFSGPKGNKGDKGGTTIKGSFANFEVLLYQQPVLTLEIGDSYILEDIERLCTWTGETWVQLDVIIPVKLIDLQDVKILPATLTNATFLAYDVSAKTWVNKEITADAGLLATKEDITVKINYGVGGLNNNEIIPAGTTFNDFIKLLVNKPTPPIYTLPTLTASCNIVSSEFGSNISPIITLNYTKQDAGIFKLCKIYRDTVLIDIISSYSPTINMSSYTIVKDSIIRIEIEYSQSDIKNDSNNNPYPSGRLPSGIVYAEMPISVKNAYWNYPSSSTSVPTSATIQSSMTKKLGIIDNGTISIVTTADTRAIVFCYPKTLGTCTEINYVDFDRNNKDIFEITEVTIPSPSGSLIVYYVYYYVAPITIGPATFILTI